MLAQEIRNQESGLGLAVREFALQIDDNIVLVHPKS